MQILYHASFHGAHLKKKKKLLVLFDFSRVCIIYSYKQLINYFIKYTTRPHIIAS